MIPLFLILFLLCLNSIALDPNIYIIENKHSHKVLDIPGGNPTPGVGLQQYTRNNWLNQQFQLERKNYKYFYIKNVDTQLYLQTPSYRDDKTQIIQNNKLNSRQQLWRMEMDDASGCYQIISAFNNQAMDIPFFEEGDGVPVNLFPAKQPGTKRDNQLFKFHRVN